MSPELETLDQLLGGDLPLAVIRGLYPDDRSFARSIHALLLNRDVRLLTHDRDEVPQWERRELFVEGTVAKRLSEFRLDLTERGARRVS